MATGILANYTFADGSGQNGQDLPYNSRNQVSLSPFFEKGPVAIRATYTWRDKYFTGIDRGEAKEVTVRAGEKEFTARVRIDTPKEVHYYQHGGILPFVLRSLL